MIVMKFGGSSLQSGAAIRRVTGIVKSHLAAKPVVVVSALGNTTNRLLQIAEETKHGHRYSAWKGIKELWECHSSAAEEVIEGPASRCLEDSLRRQFTALHRLVATLEDEGRELTPALYDEILSYGERLSSEIVNTALHSAGVPSVRVDARQLILTDNQHTHATPLYWETYAKLRRVIPRLAIDRTVVMGGFIGATESGVTTTLGRGGSDLTASIVGAAFCAEEVQIWTDVDGILTCDPRVFDRVYKLKSISYQEAAAMAYGGAKVLHPDTVAPAMRQRIPITVRNSRRPEVAGTRVVATAEPCAHVVKSIACKSDLTVLELRLHGDPEGNLNTLRQLCGCHGVSPEFLAQNGDATYLAVKSSDRYDRLQMDIEGCVEVRLRMERAILTLVGADIPQTPGLKAQVLDALKNTEAVVLWDHHEAPAMSVVVPQCDLRKCVEALHRDLFSRPDPRLLADVQRPVPEEGEVRLMSPVVSRPQAAPGMPHRLGIAER
ncbi:MAG: aspartate kinase [Bryobacteraceae bacterium]